MSVGLLDIGTNSVRLLIPDPDNLLNSSKFIRVTRIGEGVNQRRQLSEEAMDRTFRGIGELLEIAGQRGVREIFAMATSAVRDAANREVFVMRLKAQTGLDLEIVSGDEEARLGYLGAVQGLKSARGEAMIVDIGGGSTELVHLREGTLHRMKSFDIGAVRLTEMFRVSDPPREEEMQSMRGYIQEVLGDFTQGFAGDLVGIGGTITTLAAIDEELALYDRKKIHGKTLAAGRIGEIYQQLLSMNLFQRQAVKGLDPLRADIIVAGTMILMTLIAKLRVKQLVVSDFDNLEGYYLKRITIDNPGNML
ncbi:MAG: hypothetical protein AVO33_03465 [delta proteobacterium ML8_F1]|nr:MAG: hypothetical protein AVO33_03465 [delta proteobacterium ML8_F1]